MEGVAPPPADTHMVETVVEVAAPPEVVWERVVAFPELPPIEDWIFRVGVAAPTGARIEGSGVGAIRRCEFTTGEFVEPIEVWDPPRELGFSVQDMPDPMREMSPYDIRPRHLDGYFRTTAGQFLLERTATGGTRLRGRTYYQLDMMPTVYWKLWADDIIHRIHLRVLRHVAHVAETDVANTVASQ
nr:SRPBCC family protein [Deltaproteobacteria bacterium]